MKKPYKIAIFEPSDIVVLAFENILQGYVNEENISVYKDCHDFKTDNYLSDSDYRCVLINPMLLNYCPRKWKNFTDNFTDASFIGIVTSFYNRNFCKRFNDCIYLSDELDRIKSVLLKNINKKHNINISDNNKLSEREIEVLSLLATGKSQKEIAERLFISLHTVISHRRNISKKLGISSVAAMAIYAVTNGLIDPDENLENFN